MYSMERGVLMGVVVAGIGPGNPKYLTLEVKETIENAEKVVAFGRVSNSLENIRGDIVGIKKVEEIIELLNENENILVLASGDPPCFYGIVEYLKRKTLK